MTFEPEPVGEALATLDETSGQLVGSAYMLQFDPYDPVVIADALVKAARYITALEILLLAREANVDG